MKIFDKRTGTKLEKLEDFLIVKKEYFNLESLLCTFLSLESREYVNLYKIIEDGKDYYIDHTYNEVFYDDQVWELLSQVTNIEKYIEEIKGSYDYIIVDSELYDTKTFDINIFKERLIGIKENNNYEY